MPGTRITAKWRAMGLPGLQNPDAAVAPWWQLRAADVPFHHSVRWPRAVQQVQSVYNETNLLCLTAASATTDTSANVK